MKKETIVVSRDKCPLDTIAEMGRKVRNSWIFLHQNVMKKFENDDSNFETKNIDVGTTTFLWPATEEYHRTVIEIDDTLRFSTTWYPVVMINAIDIAFETMSDDPENLFFIKMV